MRPDLITSMNAHMAKGKPEPEPMDEFFASIWRDVASGRKVLEEGWQEWLDHCKATGKEPVKKPTLI